MNNVKVLNSLKVVLINFFIFLFIIIIIELFFGTWFKNNFQYKLSSERNINKVYKLDFEYHKEISHYVKNNYGFRINKEDFDPAKVDVVFAGGSTVNQKFLNYEDTLVGIINEKTKDIKIANTGIDGMSIKGHINSFELWFNKIPNFSPKYFVYIIGINDRYLVDTLRFRDHIDNLEESTTGGNVREFFESNSFFYNLGRKLKSILYLKYNLEIGVKKVKLNHVYLDRTKIEFISYIDREKEFNKLDKKQKNKYIKFKKWYLEKLNELTNLVYEKNSTPIFITQITGYGHSHESYIVAKTIIEHCKNLNLKCLDAAKYLDLKYEDFYDESHLNVQGSKKLAEYIYNNLSIFAE